MHTGIRIKIQGICPEDGDVIKFNDAANFITSTIERVAGRDGSSTVALDPLTGEPYNPVVIDPEVVKSIGVVGVVSPYSMLQILQRSFSSSDADMIEVAPILIDTADIED
jgi:hypothetical protein